MFLSDMLSWATQPICKNEHQDETPNATSPVMESKLSLIRNAAVEDRCLQSPKEVSVQGWPLDKKAVTRNYTLL